MLNNSENLTTSGEDSSQAVNPYNIPVDIFKAAVDHYKNNLANNNNPAMHLMSMQGFVENYQRAYNNFGVQESQARIVPDYILREMEKKSPIIGSCVDLRIRQIRRFSMPSAEDTDPGFKIKMLKEEKNPSKETLAEIEAIQNFFYNCGLTNFNGWEIRETLHDVMTMMVRDYLTIDKIAIELRKSRSGKIVDFWIHDAATIRRVAPGGYRGRKNDFDSRMWVTWTDEFFEKLRAAKIENLPPLEEIAYVQEIDGGYVAAFRFNELIFDSMNKRSDIKYRYTGFSPTEKSIVATTAFLYALAYNAEAFNTGAIPKIGIGFEDGGKSKQQLEEYQDQWMANFMGVKGQWRVPMFNGKINVIDFMKSARDMEYSEYLQMTGSFTCSIFGVDPAEIGLRFNQAQNVLSENIEGKMQFSKDRGLHDILGGIENVMNKIMRICGWSNRYRFEFTGLKPQDKELISRMRTESVKRDKTINEIRAEQDLPPDKYGDIILDPTYMQYRMMQMQNEQQGQGDDDMSGFDEGDSRPDEEDETRDVVDEAADELADEMLNKAKLIKARTLLIH